MAEEKLIGEPIQKSPFHQVRVTVKAWEGRPYIHCRLWMRPRPKDGVEPRAPRPEDYKPTPAGITITPDQARALCGRFRELEDVLAAMD